MNDIQIREIVETQGSPSYLFDLGRLEDRISSIREILGERIELCYSMKANPFLLNTIEGLVNRIEVCSPGELSICEELHIDMSKVIYSGVNKGKNDITCAITCNVGACTAESIHQLDLLENEANIQGKVIDVLIRLNANSQFGMRKKDFEEALNRNYYRHLNIVGIHFFVGTQRKKIENQVDELQELREYIKYLREQFDLEAVRLEYGPGLSVPYYANDDFSDTLLPLKEIIPQLQMMSEDDIEITVEMGRFMVADCGQYLTKVVDIKKSEDDINYCIVDGGINHLNYYGQTMGMKVPVIRKVDCANMDQSEKENSAITSWCLCGSICSVSDVLIRKVELEGLQIGDIIVFENVGAYTVTEGMYLFLSRDMPKILAVNKSGKMRILREGLATYLFNIPMKD